MLILQDVPGADPASNASLPYLLFRKGTGQVLLLLLQLLLLFPRREDSPEKDTTSHWLVSLQSDWDTRRVVLTVLTVLCVLLGIIVVLVAFRLLRSVYR